MKIRLRTIAIALACAAAAAWAFVYSGRYNIAATVQHTEPVYRLLDYVMRRSVKLRTGSAQPPDLADAQRIRNGFRLYRAKCLQCHGAPGIAPQDFALGMTPAPANLVATAREWPAAEIFWVARYGIKMSGMPAWQYRLSEREIWDVVAFVKALPTLSPTDYERWNDRPPAPATASPADALSAESATLGDPKAGRRAIDQHLCATCHRIPGITGAIKDVGPPLNGIGTRKYIAGVLPNNPANMIRWLRHPKQVDPLSAMPDLNVQDKDARDMAAYLYTLKDLD